MPRTLADDLGHPVLLPEVVRRVVSLVPSLTEALAASCPERLVGATDWLASQPGTGSLMVGLFGASTGGGAALVAAAQRPDRIGAVVSRGGRPDLAHDALPLVQAPTLLIVGGEDHAVIEMNREALGQLRCEKRLEIVPGATHLFEEPGALEAVAGLAQGWFRQHLMPAGGP